MLVGSGLEHYVISLNSLVARDRVRKNRFIGVSDMWFAGCIGNCGSNIIRSFVCHDLFLSVI